MRRMARCSLQKSALPVVYSKLRESKMIRTIFFTLLLSTTSAFASIETESPQPKSYNTETEVVQEDSVPMKIIKQGPQIESAFEPEEEKK